jgi:hypothetical protein
MRKNLTQPAKVYQIILSLCNHFVIIRCLYYQYYSNSDGKLI